MKTSLFKRGRQDLKLAENSALRGIDMSGGGGAVLVAATLRIADSACPGLFRALAGVRRDMIEIVECVATHNANCRDDGVDPVRSRRFVKGQPRELRSDLPGRVAGWGGEVGRGEGEEGGRK